MVLKQKKILPPPLKLRLFFIYEDNPSLDADFRWFENIGSGKHTGAAGHLKKGEGWDQSFFVCYFHFVYKNTE